MPFSRSVALTTPSCTAGFVTMSLLNNKNRPRAFVCQRSGGACSHMGGVHGSGHSISLPGSGGVTQREGPSVACALRERYPAPTSAEMPSGWGDPNGVDIRLLPDT